MPILLRLVSGSGGDGQVSLSRGTLSLGCWQVHWEVALSHHVRPSLSNLLDTSDDRCKTISISLGFLFTFTYVI